MNPERGISHTDRWSDGISTIPHDLETLTHKYACTNDALVDPLSLVQLHVILVERGLALRYVYVYIYRPRITADVTITTSTLLMHQEPYHGCVRYMTRVPSLASAVLRWPLFPPFFGSLFPTQFDLLFLT